MLKRALTTALILASAPLYAAEFLGKYTWSWPTDDPRFGGVSGIEVLENGHEFIAVSDHGSILNGTLKRTQGSISGVSAVIEPLMTTKNKAVRGNNRDAEGIALSSDGRIFVSYEGNHRVAEHSSTGAKTKLLPRHADFTALQRNSGLEGLAIDSGGALFAIPERSGATDRPFPLYRFTDGSWSIVARIPRRGSFLPVGLDFGSDGKLYLLERHLSIFGFQSRIRSFALEAPNLEEQTVLRTSPGQFDNLEGISIWLDADGSQHITLISDDNFKIYQRTEIVEYRILPSD